ncbi:MAG TPA: hypothetical protein VIM30_03705 [Candidatus Limnocylindrales bacterium]|jgi:hypothetical protein
MTGPRTTGVWISANSATVLRWSPELTVRHRIDSRVPGRHRSTGRQPTEERPGGEGHRDEHMRAFFDHVAQALPVADDLLLVGDGEVVEHFAEQVRTDDDSHGRKRRIEVEKGGPLTERQLLARIRTFAGSPAKRYLPR